MPLFFVNNKKVEFYSETIAEGIKGQTKSKQFFQADVSSKKRTNEWILLYYFETSGRLVFVRFLEEIEDTKNISKLTDL